MGRARDLWTRPVKPVYKCTVHGPFRTYNDYLSHLKNWCQLVVTITIIPLTLILEALKVIHAEAPYHLHYSSLRIPTSKPLSLSKDLQG